jgi:hypothetical protein
MMAITKSDTQKAVRALLKASGELAYVANLVRPDPEDPAATSYRKAIARIIMTIFDELSIPLYHKYPDLIPEREREIVEAALRRIECDSK